MRDTLLDARHAARLLRRHRGFTLFVVITLGVGIGAATLVFTLVHAALLRALPFDRPDSLVWMYNARAERDRAPFSVADLEDYRRENQTLAGLAVFTNWSANLTGAGTPERIEGTRVSGDFFRLLGARPLIGRTLEPADESGDARVTVLTHGFWIRRFGADPTVVGRAIALNGASHVVVGVLPPGFMFPFREAEVAVPIDLRRDPRRADRGANFLRVVARLAPDVTLMQAKADLDTIARRLQLQYSNENARKIGVNLYPLHSEIVRDYRQMLWTLLAAVGVVLVVACGNVANLMLVRALGRRAEIRLRASLGASRGRLLRQLAMESALLAVAGGALGLVLCAAGLEAWRVVGPANFPRHAEVSLNVPVLAFAFVVACCAALVCALVPARSMLRNRDLTTTAATSGDTRTTTSGRHQHVMRRAFVTLQVAGAVVLLVCMGLVARSFARLSRVDAGFAADRALSWQVSLPPRVFTTRDAIERFYEDLHSRLAAMPGVRAAGAVSLRPLTGLLSATDVGFPDRPAPPPDEVPQAHFRIASPEYFAAAGIPILAGRAFTERDLAPTPPVAIVSRAFADRHWPGERAVGKRVQLLQSSAAVAPQASASTPALEIVGVVADVKQFAMEGPRTADLYVPLAQTPTSQVPFLVARMYWIVRTQGEPRQVAAAVRDAVEAVNPDVATSGLQTLDELVSASLGGWRINVRLLEVFGQLAVLLCAAGVYGVAAFSADARRRELAIRAAFGADRADLLALMLRDELRPVAIGLALGFVAAVVVSRQLGALLFETHPLDAATYIAVGVGVLVVALLASYLPARRAGRSDPIDLLRV